VAPSDLSSQDVGLDQAEAALVQHYPRLVRLSYLVLPPAPGHHHRVLAAHALVQRALPRGKAAEELPAVPAQRDGDPGYGYLRLRVLRAALDAGRPGRAWWLRRVPRLLPQVVGLRLFPRAGEADETAVEQQLAGLPPAGRAAYALRRFDGLSGAAIRELLGSAGVPESKARAAVRDAAAVALSPALTDPCLLQVRPTDLLRRRRHARTALIGAAALALAVGAVVLLPDGWGPDGAAAPPYARNVAAEAALDPQGLRRIPEGVWRQSSRTDFSVWPARGAALDDTRLLRRALAVWARPGADVAVTATPGTQTGPAPGPAQLLYAGEAGGMSVVLLYDGLRIVRYAEPAGAASGGAALDFARVDSADLVGASAVVVGRGDGNTRYLTAPWVSEAETSDLLDPAGRPAALTVDEHGVTGAVRAPAGGDEAAECREFPVLAVTAQGADLPFLLADLGELTPVLLTHGAPGAERTVAAAGQSARGQWARIACHLPAVGGAGVRSVNAWQFAEQTLPDGAGAATWVCSRAETWRGAGSRALAQFLPPASQPGEQGAVTAVAEEGPACGTRQPQVLSGVVWRSPADAWYLVAAGSEQVTGIAASGGVTGRADGRTLTLPAEEGTEVELTAELADGGELAMLH
jgi:DNA-directed RNA polymerase specialized sigma24 family protein